MSFSFHILFATVGRSTLSRMLLSVKLQLKKQDAITIVFDGKKNNLEPTFFNGFECEVNIHEEPKPLGMWGLNTRQKYKHLISRRDFVLHADDDDIFNEGSIEKLRSIITNKHTLYIAPALLEREGNIIIPYLDVPKRVAPHYIANQNGVVPFDLNNKWIWGNTYEGDGYFLQQCAKHALAVVFIDHTDLILQIKNPVQFTKVSHLDLILKA